ncbi:zinc finger protein Rlf isoform X1 [Empidonax traillii]|uniref:zinc finger protein Rlf isoform X1 n=1 Tax=Empidonax traillii TaxID=164674 RepID=UPI000FFD936D|nr:zinc finger protein Rlf isoform X1 [Empidonax traillii]
MADAEAEAAARPEVARGVPALRARLRQLQAELREQEVSEASSRAYCRGFCQTLLQYAGSRSASEHILPFLEVYRISIQSFANARPYLTTECEDVLLVLGRLVLSCFELLLSIPESELPHEVWLGFHQSIQDSHDALLEFGNNNLQILVDITREGVWKNPILLKILSQQPVETEEANKLITREGPSFLQMRIKHLMKSNCIPQATLLSKLCADSPEIANVSSFRQAYITCVCSMLPNEDSIKEIAKVDCKEVLDIICNLESEGQENTAFILCTTYLTHQLQTANVYCSWELTLFWSKLQRRIDPSLDSFLERCRQFGIIAKTLQHLFFLIRVIQSEAEEAGLAVSVLLCVRALQIRSSGSDEMKTSVCKTIACLLPEDLEVRRACQLTEFLLEPTLSGFNALEELYMQPDQKFDEENAVVPNSLRCELLLALKAYWPFDPEFWDWKTLKRHCLKLLGKVASDSEDDTGGYMSLNETDMLETFFSDYDEAKEHKYYDEKDTMNHPKEKARVKKPIGSSERYQRWLQYKFFCVLCKRECIEARILHHSKMHMEDGVYTCPVCTKKFKRKEFFVPHVMEHVKMPPSRTHRPKKKIILKKETSPQKTTASGSPPPAFQEGSHQSQFPESFDNDTHEYVTFSQLENCQLQDRDIYPCPGTDCSRVFKQFKYLSVHLKAEHQNNDENAKHYLDMKNRREKCAFCRRHFMTSFHLREHERVHCGPQPYMCVSMDCYARFGSVNELLNHKQTHDDLRYKCELNGCNIVFSDLGQLYHHEAQHFRDASYTCNFFGCKKFYYSKTEFQNHLAAHNIQVSNGEGNLERSVSEDKCSYLQESQLLEQSENSNHNDNLDPSGSQEIPQVKEESLSDSEDLNSESNYSLHCGEHRADAAVSQGRASPLLLETVAHSQSVPGLVVSQEGVFHPANVKQHCSNVAVCFDEKTLSCGFEGCCSIHKNSRSMQKHLRRAHPYSFKGKRNMEMKTKYFLDLLSDAQDSKSPTDINTELGHNSDTNADSPESVCCAVDAKGSNGLREETCPSSPEMSFYDSSKESNIEDNMLELMLGLKHLSLKNANIQNSSRHRPFGGYSSRDAKCPELVDETTSEFQLQEQQGNLPSQYLTQLAAKPFFCECQGCTCEFVTREALLMHYVRKHNYSKEMVLQLNMFQHRYSPFKCHICQRSFTRKTHLRIHYRNKHQIGCERVAHKVCPNEKLNHVGLCTEDVHKNGTAPAPACANSVGFPEHSDHSEQLCLPKKDDCCSETDLESSEETDNNVTRKASNIGSLDTHREELEARQGRGSKRTVAKGNLCYILHKYHKPFHCIHKSCNSAFTNQKGLIRHYRTVHQYNKEQLCLEKDKARTKRELVKCKKIFACKHKDCGKRFLCSKALAKHCSDFHNEILEDQKLLSEAESARFACNQAHCPAVFYTFNKLKQHLIEEHANEEKLNKDFEIHCDLNGCNRIFTNYSHYSQHVYFRHSEYYDSLFGNQKEEEDNEDKDKNEQNYLKDSFDTSKQNGKQIKEKAKRISKSREKHLLSFKTKEEALQMCKEKSNQTQYPCMVQGCLSVVKLESSIVRHYKRTHQMTNMYIEQRLQKLVLCVKCGIMTEKQSCSNTASDLDRKDVEVNEDKSANPEPVQESDKPLVPNPACDPPKVSNEDQKQSPPSSVSFDASAFVHSGTLKYNHSSKNTCFEEPDVRETAVSKTEDFSENSEREKSPCFSSLQLELPKEKDPEGCQHSAINLNGKRNVLCATKDKFQKPPVSKPFDLKTYKPMGFESSFLKFIQESEGKDYDDDDDDDCDEVLEWESSEQLPIGETMKKEEDSQGDTPVNSFVNDENVPITPNNPGQLTEIQPLLSESSSAPSLENLRAILDKALTDCGDLALKQLHYLRPVVVLERSKFSTPLIDLFPTKKADELCVGST